MWGDDGGVSLGGETDARAAVMGRRHHWLQIVPYTVSALVRSV